MQNILVTGAAGFIGFYLSKRLLEQGQRVIGIDNVNDYYDVRLKEFRLDILSKYDGFTFIKGDLADKGLIDGLWRTRNSTRGFDFTNGKHYNETIT